MLNVGQLIDGPGFVLIPNLSTASGAAGARGPSPPRPPLMAQVIWMLQDFTEHNGATLVAPRSQLRCARPNREQFALEAIKVTGAAGDAIISHGLLWHDTSPNRTEEPRVAVLINYGLKVIRPL